MALGSGYVLQLATIAVGFWITPLSLRLLGREQFAVFILIADLLVWMNLLDLGITAGLKLQASQIAGSDNHDRLNKLASTAFYSQIVVVLCVVIAGGALSFAFPNFFTIGPQLEQDAKWVMLLMLAGVALSIGTQTFSALLIASQQVHIDNAVGLLNLTIRTAVTVGLLKSGYGIYSLAIANILGKIISSSLCVVRTFRVLPKLQLRLSLVSWETLRGTGTTGIWFTVSSLVAVLMSTADKLVVGRIISVPEIATLTLTGRLYTLTSGLLANITNNARPMLGQLIGQNKMAKAGQTHENISQLSTGFAIVAATSLWVGNRAFVVNWVGAQNYGGWILDVILSLNLVARTWALPNRAILSAGLYKISNHALSGISEAILSVALAATLGSFFGIAGAASGIILATLLVPFWYLPKLTAEMFQLHRGEINKTSPKRMLICTIVMIGLAACARLVTDALNVGFLGSILAMICTAILGFWLFWSLGFNEQIKSHILGHTSRLGSKFSAQYKTL